MPSWAAQQVIVGRARLQPVRGQLRALPRRRRPRSARHAARHRPGAQSPGQAVRPPVGRLPEQHDGRRRPVRLRQPQLDHARVVERGTPAGSAELHPDRRPDLVHPGTEHPDLHDPRPGAVRAARRPGHERGPDVHRLGRRQLQAGARLDAVPGLLVERVRDGVGRPVRCAGGLGRPECDRRRHQGRRVRSSTRRR